jgi:hypothetical protein
MAQPKYARVSKSFVTNDRKEAVFMLRMIEEKRTKYCVDVVNDLRAVCRKYGFNWSPICALCVITYSSYHYENIRPRIRNSQQ